MGVCKACAAAHRRLRHLAADVGQIAKTSIQHGTFISPTRAAERVKICAACPLLDAGRGVCDEAKGGCGCFVRARALLTAADCPKGKWPRDKGPKPV